MRSLLQQCLQQALQALVADGKLPAQLPTVHVERSRNAKHGDFSSNAALLIAKQAACTPLELARQIVDRITDLPEIRAIERIEVAQPGFINFFLGLQFQLAAVLNILRDGERYGHGNAGAGKSVLLEFVSANPTGPLHIGHGRGATLGNVLARLLRTAGYRVDCEYYINDAGRQMDILALSVWLRYLEITGRKNRFPDGAYQGDYLIEIAAELRRRHGRIFALPGALELPQGADDAEQHLDQLIAFSKTRLGAVHYQLIADTALKYILDDIKTDLRYLGIDYQNWFSERSLLGSKTLQDVLSRLDKAGRLYTHADAVWFSAREFGDEKDRVLVRKNGQPTYFAADLAYHVDKFSRGYDLLINIWGADHHGYAPRLTSALQALGEPCRKLDILLVQFANLYRGKEKLPMSTRSGSYITLKSLYEEISVDAARVFYSMRRTEQHLNFDLELAKSRSRENPVYYIQYAHARICSVLRRVTAENPDWQPAQQVEFLLSLTEPEEEKLISRLSEYRDVVEAAARKYEPHRIVHYLQQLADDFHCYYNAHRFQVQDARLRNARLSLIQSCKTLLANGLAILGVTAAEKM